MERTQASLEYVTIYILGIVMVLFVGYGMYVIGAFDPERPKAALGFDYFQPTDWKVTGRDSKMSRTFHMIIQNKDPEVYEVTYVKFYRTDRKFCGESNKHHIEIIKYGDEIDAGGILYENCTSSVGDDFTYLVDIGYKSKISNLEHVDDGRLMGEFESSESAPMFSGWERSWYGSDMTTREDGSVLGSYAGSCPPAVPPSGVSWVSGGAPQTWNQPVSCAAGECHGVGASAHCSQTCSYMAHGWLKASVISPREAKGHGIWLWGNGVCDPDFTYDWMEANYGGGYHCPDGNATTQGFVCLNDDLYFFLNGQLAGFSGLSYHAYKCNECAATDYWCVPPIDVTQAEDFRWDEPNYIYILVEDWCISGGIGQMDFYVG